MSRSIHITLKNFRGLTSREIDEQYVDPTSELNQWAYKLHIKKTRVKARKESKMQKKEQENEISKE